MKRRSKLNPWSDGPFEVIEKINDNVYKVDLPGDYGVLGSFNVADLRPYYDDAKGLPSLRSNFVQPEEDDMDSNWVVVQNGLLVNWIKTIYDAI